MKGHGQPQKILTILKLESGGPRDRSPKLKNAGNVVGAMSFVLRAALRREIIFLQRIWSIAKVAGSVPRSAPSRLFG